MLGGGESGEELAAGKRERAVWDLSGGELGEQGHEIHFTSVSKHLRQLGYSMQANRKTKEGSNHLDRGEQFHHINAKVSEAMGAASQRSRSTPRRRTSLGT